MPPYKGANVERSSPLPPSGRDGQSVSRCGSSRGPEGLWKIGRLSKQRWLYGSRAFCCGHRRITLVANVRDQLERCFPCCEGVYASLIGTENGLKDDGECQFRSSAQPTDQ